MFLLDAYNTPLKGLVKGNSTKSLRALVSEKDYTDNNDKL